MALVLFIPLVVFFFIARTSRETAGIYVIVVVAYELALGIVVLVKAFRTGVGTGLACLFVPFYVLYFVFGKGEDSGLKVAYAASIVGVFLAGFLMGELQMM